MHKKIRGLALTSVLLIAVLSSCAAGQTPPSTTPTVSIAPNATPTASSSSVDSRGIIGSYYTDITLGLEDFGLTDHSYVAAPEEAKSTYSHSSTALVDNAPLDTSFDYSLTMDNDAQIIGASFGATWLANDSNADFITTAAVYLSYAATMPYDTSDADTVKAWVNENIPSVADGDGVSTTVGDATFELFGSKTDDNYTMFILDISKTS